MRNALPNVARLLVLAAAIGACAAPVPATQPAAPRLPVACHASDLAVCEHVATLAVEAAERGPARWAEVRFVCEGACGPALQGRRDALVTIELGGGDALSLRLTVVDGSVTRAEQADFGLFRVEPASQPVNAPTAELELGHCGLLSAIDVDASLWSPIGLIPNHPDAINSARARVTFTGPNTALLQTAGGMSVEMVRHEGAKHLPGCD